MIAVLDYMKENDLYEYACDTWGNDQRTKHYHSVQDKKAK